MGSEEAYVTFGANDSSALGCIVLGHSLRKHGTSRTLVAVVTEDINPTLRSLLSDIFDLVQCVSKLKMNQVQNNTTYCSPEANLALAKVNCWLLTQFSKCVFLEADTLVLQNCDELFERTELSAVPDVGWPDCFNSGVFVFIPSLHTYYALIEILRNYGSFDGSDQGLLNQHFGRGWQLDLSKRLPFIYNLMSTSSYTYAPAYHQFGKNAKIVHFMEYPKPWSVPWDSNTGKIRISPGTAHQDRFLQEWLDIFLQKVLPLLPEVETDVATVERNNEAPTKLLATAQATITAPPQATTSTTAQYTTSAFAQAAPPPDQNLFADWLPPEVSKDSAPSYEQTYNRVTSPPAVDTAVYAVNKSAEPIKESNTFQLSPLVGNESTYSQHTVYETTAESSFGLGSSTNVAEAELTQYEDTDQVRLKEWDEGRMDYQGRDSFDNIWRRLQHFIEEIPSDEPEAAFDCGGGEDDAVVAQTASAANDDSSTESNTPHPESEMGLPGYPVGDYAGMHRWEQGNIDYVGIDSSDIIMRRLDYLIHGRSFLLDQS